jgi:hypothetical protein
MSMTRKFSIGALLVSISIAAASAATAAPSGGAPSDVYSSQKHERTHRPSLIQAIKYKVMSMVGEAKGAIAGAEARNAQAKAVMAEKAKAAMAAKGKAALATRSGASMAGQAPCPQGSIGERPTSLDKNRCQ